MDPFEQLWGPSPRSGPGPLTMSIAGGRLPAGMRNNNPGNIKFFPGASYAGVVGPSQNRDQGDPQMVFDTPENGMRAASQLALKKYSGGKRSANALIAGNMGWTPGNTSAASNIARTMGIGPDDDLALSDPSRLQSFLRALTLQEHGSASKLYGDDVYAAVNSAGAPVARQEAKPMPQPQNSLTSAIGGGWRDNIPQMLGGTENQGYFGRMFQDPMFMMGASVLGAGLSGRDAGSALTQGAQAASATSEMTEKRRRAAQWQKLMQGEGGGMEGITPDIRSIMQAMGPEEGMRLYGQMAMERIKRNAPREMAPGATLYDPTKNEALFTAPTSKESPYAETVQRERAKADVDAEGRGKVGQQMLGLLEGVRGLAGKDGTPQAELFEQTVGPLQGTGAYQKAKGFFNSKAESPQVYNDVQQYLGTLRMLAQRAYLSGQGQVTEAERRAVNDAIGAVETAPSREASLRAITTLEGIVQGVFMKPPQAQTAPGASAPPPNVVAPGISVEGGAPQPAPAAPQPSGRPRITDGQGNVMELDESGTKWVPAQPQPQPGAPGPAGPALPPGISPAQAAAGAAGGPVPAQNPFNRNMSPLGPRAADRGLLQQNPQLAPLFDQVFGQGAAAKVLRPGPSTMYRSFGG